MPGQSVQNPGYKTFLAGEDMVAHRRVGIKSGTTTWPPEVEYVDAGVQAIGMTMSDVKDGDHVAVRLMSDNGTFLGVAADSFALDATLYAADNGMISDTASGTAIGKALEAATALNDIVEWMPFPVISTTAATVSVADAGSHTAETTVEGVVTELYEQVHSVLKRIDIPLTSFLDVAGTQLSTFADGASDQPGFELTNSEALSIRWNDHAAPLAIMSQFQVPNDADITANMTMKMLASKVGATIGDAVTFTVAAFNQVVGALHDADADFGGATGAMTGDATSKTVQSVSRTLALANLGAVGTNVTFTLKPTAGTLGTDDVCLHAVWVEYKGKTVAS